MQKFQQVTGPMTNERFKQEAALIALRSLCERNNFLLAAAKKLLACEPRRRLNNLVRFEECEAGIAASLAEAVGEAMALKFGPDTTEEAP